MSSQISRTTIVQQQKLNVSKVLEIFDGQFRRGAGEERNNRPDEGILPRDGVIFVTWPGLPFHFLSFLCI
jgi:hypothetical protein